MKFMNQVKYLNGLRHIRHANFEGEGGGGGGGGGGSDDPTFASALPEEYREHAAFKDFKDLGGLAKSFLDTQAMVGGSIRIPGEDASDEIRTDFNNKILEKAPHLMHRPNFDDAEQTTNFYKGLGVPDESSAYEIPEATAPEGVNYDPESLIPFKEIAKKHNLTAGQFKGVMEDFQAMSFGTAQAQNEAQKTAIGELAKEWGHAYEGNMKTAINIAEKTGAPETVIEGMKNGTMPPGMVKYFHTLAAKFGKEGTDLGDDNNDGGDPNALAPAEAQYQLNEILGNKEHAYWNAKDPNHAAARKKAMELTLMANPGMSSDEGDLYKSTTVING